MLYLKYSDDLNKEEQILQQKKAAAVTNFGLQSHGISRAEKVLLNLQTCREAILQSFVQWRQPVERELRDAVSGDGGFYAVSTTRLEYAIGATIKEMGCASLIGCAGISMAEAAGFDVTYTGQKHDADPWACCVQAPRPWEASFTAALEMLEYVRVLDPHGWHTQQQQQDSLKQRISPHSRITKPTRTTSVESTIEECN